MIKRLIKKTLNAFGFDIIALNSGFPPEATEEDQRVAMLVRDYTMTSNERLWALISAVKYILRSDIDGDFVECGVWRGGSAMAMAEKLARQGDMKRRIWLYDTFAGMTEPSVLDVEIHSGVPAEKLLASKAREAGNNVWCIASRKDVVNNLSKTGLPADRVVLVEGDILQTLEQQAPETIALLRLDTDWYESTRKELEILYPRLVSGGVCIIDDYGHWQGARKAVDEYLELHGINVLMHKIDGSGRIFVKP